MSQMRDTILPVCQIVEVEAAILSTGTGDFGVSSVVKEVQLRATGTEVLAVKAINGSLSGFPDGVSSCTVSSTGTEYERATFTINTGTQAGVSAVPFNIIVTNGGLYSGDCANFGVVNVVSALTGASIPEWNSSGVFEITTTKTTAEVPYVSVTPVSGAGNNGFFRILPGSSSDFYAIDNSGTGSGIELSGIGGSKPGLGAASADFGVSGWPGVVAAHNQTATLTLQPSQKVSSIHIDNQIMSNFVGAKTIFAVNYGVVKHANPQRDDSLTDIR